jgi:hypothetical protein
MAVLTTYALIVLGSLAFLADSEHEYHVLRVSLFTTAGVHRDHVQRCGTQHIEGPYNITSTVSFATVRSVIYSLTMSRACAVSH